MDAALDSVSPAAEAKNITIDRHVADLEPVTGDRDRLQQVFWNLLSNAVKFTPRNGRVTVELTREGDDAVILVRDTGIGISADFLPYVFDRFSQADASATRRHGGLGLGMAIVRYLVELHGGTVRVESDGENRGATFTAVLPLRVLSPLADVGQPLPRAVVEDTAGEELPQLSGVRILVVDDQQDSRAFLGTLLQNQGATVCSAGSAPEALQAFARERPDVVVSDIAMPGEDGYDLIRQLRALPASDGGHTPAVALTAYVRHEDAAAALAAGYQRHIRKPVIVSELIGAVAELAAAPSRAE
jgi:CheY-like chemotaxis protein/anti-sigma regulatory factor (Ser/Thr protein kinase)